MRDLLYHEQDLIDWNFGRIQESEYKGGHVGILFLDIVKERDISDAVSELFLPNLRDDAVVVHQDYFHPQHPYIAASVALNSDALQYVGRPESDEWMNSGVFELIDCERLRKSPTMLFEIDRSKAEDAIQYAVNLHTCPIEKMNLLASYAVLRAEFLEDAKAAERTWRDECNARGIGAILDDPSQERHRKRAIMAFQQFARGNKKW